MPQVPCARCGTFLPEPGLCAACTEKAFASRQLGRRARFVALCLGVTALLLLFPALYSALASRDAGILLFGLMPTAPLLASGAVVLRQQRPGAGLAGLLACLLCPTAWLLAIASIDAPRGRFLIGLAALGWLLSLWGVNRLFVLRRHLSARGLLPRAG